MIYSKSYTVNDKQCIPFQEEDIDDSKQFIDTLRDDLGNSEDSSFL